MESGENINENAEGASGQESTPEAPEAGTIDNPSAHGANPDLPGFTPGNLHDHFGGGEKSDHSDQYPHFTKEQYAQRALELVQSPVGDGIEGYKATHGLFIGSIVRYDTSLNDWVRGVPTGIATMFKPDDKASYFEMINRIETRGG